MPMMGRSPLEEPMIHKVSLRFTEKEYRGLKVYAEAINKTMTDTLKDGIALFYEKESLK